MVFRRLAPDGDRPKRLGEWREAPGCGGRQDGMVGDARRAQSGGTATQQLLPRLVDIESLTSSGGRRGYHVDAIVTMGLGARSTDRPGEQVIR
jgi:hypothetical protein